MTGTHFAFGMWTAGTRLVWRRVLAVLGILALCLLSPLAHAQGAGGTGAPLHVLTDLSPVRMDIGTRMEVLVDPTRAMDIDAVRSPNASWQAIDRPSPNFGFTAASHWFRFRVRNDTQTVAPRMLELPISFLDDVRLFHFQNDALQVRYALGDEQPFAQRVVRHRNFVMPLTLEPGYSEIYLRLTSSGTIEGPLRLWDPAAFAAATADENLQQGMVIGVLAIMIIYNLFIYFSTRDVNYLYYIGFVASYLGFHLTLSGYSFAYVWPHAVAWNRFAISTFVASAMLFTCLFSNSFLQLKRFSTTGYLTLKGLAWLSGVLLVGTFVLPYSLTIRIGAAITLPLIATSLFMGYLRWWKGARFARFYCMAWTAILISLAVLNASKHGWIVLNFWTEHASQIGIVLLVTLLSFTLADQINNDRTLRLNAQAVALAHERKTREAQQALIHATEDANRELEQRVQARTHELHDTLQQLQDANAQLQRMSTTDALTQLANRARFDAVAQDELRRAERHGAPFSIIIFDIDHFKRLNDTYGHLAGDACLRALAQALQPCVHRVGDLLARYGGEEFVVILSEAHPEQAVAFAEMLRQTVAQLEVVHDQNTLRFTASFGVTSALATQSLQVADYLACADQALYQAKAEGRNAVRFVAVPGHNPKSVS